MTKTRRERHRERHVAVRATALLAGVAAVLAGLALLVLPGPGIPVLVAGLGLLSLEFLWAERLLGHVLRRAARITPARRGHRVALALAAAALAVAGIAAGTVLL